MTHTLPRILRLSTRPLFTFALALSPLIVLAAIRFAQHGMQPAILFLALTPLILYAVIVTIVLSQRITISRDAIETTTLFRFHRRIPFSTITRTEGHALGTPPRPVRLLIHTSNHEEPLITISLKAVALEDAIWLASLPELKTDKERKA